MVYYHKLNFDNLCIMYFCLADHSCFQLVAVNNKSGEIYQEKWNSIYLHSLHMQKRIKIYSIALLCLLMVCPRLSCRLPCSQLWVKRWRSMHCRQACVYTATRSREVHMYGNTCGVRGRPLVVRLPKKPIVLNKAHWFSGCGKRRKHSCVIV